jgi:chemotaxis protein methyltransferase CheR
VSNSGNWTEAARRAADYVAARTGLSFAPHRKSELLRGLRQTEDEGQGARDPERLVRRLESDPESWERLLDTITVGETYFFREPEHFEFVRQEVLPAIVAERGPDPSLRVWSAGCASGEEVYSLAILLHRHGLLSRASLLGTDISRVALARAREAQYRSWSLRGMDLSGLEPYFVTDSGRFRVSDEIRRSVRFEKLNLADAQFPSPTNGTATVDLIFCRNVFIYLNAETIRQVADRFFRALRPGGYLILGPSDPLLAESGFEVLTTRAGIVYRKPPAALGAEPVTRISEPKLPGNLDQRGPRGAPVLSARPSDDDFAGPPSLLPPAPAELKSAAEIRDLANRNGAAFAERACSRALELAPLSIELHYLQGVLLLELADTEGAVSALRRALYLDADLAIAHFTLGSLLSKVGDRRGAERAFRNAESCARKTPSEQPLPLSDGLLAGGVARAAQRELGLIADSSRSRQ